jgi:hypothetical protein
MKKICEVCGVEENFHDVEEHAEILLGLCERCMNDFRQRLDTE